MENGATRSGYPYSKDRFLANGCVIRYGTLFRDEILITDDKSPLVSEYVRAFLKRMGDQRPPEQLSLPIE